MVYMRYTLRKDDNGVAGVVAFFLIIVVIVSIVSVVAVLYIPVWARDGEVRYVEKVEGQFISLKDRIDVVRTDPVSGVFSTYVTLISEPTESFLGISPLPTRGELQFNPTKSTFTLYNANNSNEIYTMSRGCLKFISNNVHYVPINYTYENGAVIRMQSGTSQMVAGPQIKIYKNSAGNHTVKFQFFTLTGDYVVTASSGSVGIDGHVIFYDENIIRMPPQTNVTLNITSECYYAWYEWLKESLLYFEITGNLSSSNYTLNIKGDSTYLTVKDVTEMIFETIILEMRVLK